VLRLATPPLDRASPADKASDFYGRIFLELIPGPGVQDVPAFLVAPTTRTRDWTTPAGEAVAWAAVESEAGR
jgi:hypothetical protein